MVWTVTYRNTHGQRDSLEIEADSRESLFAELKRRGIAAISVAEGRAKRGRGHSGTGILPVRKKNGRDARSTMRGIVAGLIVVAGAVGIFLFFTRGAENATPEIAPQKVKAAKTTLPAVAPRIEAKPVEQKKPLSNWDIRHLSKDETNQLNEAEQRYWKMYHPDVPVDENQPVHNKGKYRIFKSRTDNDIAFLMATEPGAPVFGSGEFFARDFERKFLKSLETPIVINPDDSDYDKELKKAVMDARAELKQRYDRGEDIEKVMRDTRAEMQRLGQYKIQVEKIIKKETSGAARKGLTEKDVADLLNAANAMLEEKGIAPIEPTPLLRRALELQSNIGEQE